LERAGVPAVSIITDAFDLTARAMARNYGFPGFEYVTVPHPVASLSAAQVRRLAHDITPRVLEILGVGR
jgi:signal transduction histidine kinase